MSADPVLPCLQDLEEPEPMPTPSQLHRLEEITRRCTVQDRRATIRTLALAYAAFGDQAITSARLDSINSLARALVGQSFWRAVHIEFMLLPDGSTPRTMQALADDPGLIAKVCGRALAAACRPTSTDPTDPTTRRK